MEWGGSVPSCPLGEEDVEELRSERSIRGLKVSISLIVLKTITFASIFHFVYSQQKKLNALLWTKTLERSSVQSCF